MKSILVLIILLMGEFSLGQDSIVCELQKRSKDSSQEHQVIAKHTEEINVFKQSSVINWDQAVPGLNIQVIFAFSQVVYYFNSEGKQFSMTTPIYLDSPINEGIFHNDEIYVASCGFKIASLKGVLGWLLYKDLKLSILHSIVEKLSAVTESTSSDYERCYLLSKFGETAWSLGYFLERSQSAFATELHPALDEFQKSVVEIEPVCEKPNSANSAKIAALSQSIALGLLKIEKEFLSQK